MYSNVRYIEISNRNPVSRILIANRNCCDEVCIEIIRAGSKNCGCNTLCPPDNPCSCKKKKPHNCCTHLEVCALEIDDDGYAVFEWPYNAMSLKEGWYEGIIRSGCTIIEEVPIRVGPRANVLKVEGMILGPDHLCPEPCQDDNCDPICPVKCGPDNTVKVYVPDEVCK